MKARSGLAIFWLLVLFLSSLPLWMSLPTPEARMLTNVDRLSHGGWQPARLPHSYGQVDQKAHYRVVFNRNGTRGDYLYLPLVSQHAVIELNGHPLADTHARSNMTGLFSGIPVLIHLPGGLMRDGRNRLDIQLSSSGLVSGYLSPVYIGSAGELAPYYRIRVFLLEHLCLMVLAAQLLITLVVLMIWLYRPRESLFGWLFLMTFTSLFSFAGSMGGLLPQQFDLAAYSVLVNTVASGVLVIVTLLIAGRSPPAWLKNAVIGVPAVCILLAAFGLASPQAMTLFFNAPVNILCFVAGLVIMVRAAWLEHNEEAWLLLLPILLVIISGLHDFAIALDWLHAPVFLSVYYRPALMIGIAMILMRRLGISLTRLDSANADLALQLQQQEHELTRLYREEQRVAARRALSEERKRLTSDLHDGLSGHLASIIALSERGKSSKVEHAAREALEDLRLVIHSLDIEERELPAALAGLRERLERQLKRLGIQLYWSLVHLPEVTGVTPASAMSVLRIVQEAITNAVKHGNASWIRVLGDSENSGMARILVENDGISFDDASDRGGAGLKNMRQRADQLRGELHIESLQNGTRLTLSLPLHLPETEAAQAGKQPRSDPPAGEEGQRYGNSVRVVSNGVTRKTGTERGTEI